VLLAEDVVVVGRLVTAVAGFAVPTGFATSEVLAVEEETGLAVVEEAGRDAVEVVFVRTALELTEEELLVDVGRATAGVELVRETGATVEEEAGRDTDDGAEVLDDVLDVAGGLLTVLEEVGRDVVCAFW